MVRYPILKSVLLLCFLTATLASVDDALSETLFSSVKDTPLAKSIPASVLNLVRTKVKLQGCPVNVCFALDGSLSVTDSGFAVQKDFVRLLTAIFGADTESQAAGTIFGLNNLNIEKLTSNTLDFIGKVDATVFPSAPVTFLGAGLGFCVNELNDAEVSGDSNRIILLQDGMSNFGDLTGPLSAAPVAAAWRNLESGNDVLSIAIGFSGISDLTPITGSPSLVFQTPVWAQLASVFEDVANKVCSLKPGPLPKPPTTPPPTTTRPTKPTKPIKPKKCPCKCLKTKTKKGKVIKARKKAKEQCKNRPHCAVTKCGKKMVQCCNVV